MKNSEGQSRNTDSTTVSNAALRRILTAAEQKKVLDEQVVILNKRIAEKDSIIALLKFKDETNEQVIQTYEDEKKVMEDQRKIFEDAIKGNEKVIRKLKRKVFWTSAGGIAGMGAMAFLLLTK